MWLKRTAIVGLVAGFLLVSSTTGDQTGEGRATPNAISLSSATQGQILTPSPSRPSSLSPFLQWRYRLKSILVPTTSRDIQDVDRGLVPVPHVFSHLIGGQFILHRESTMSVLRC
jgi:DNA-binding transcriptional regulator YdaS (Cro superfamily)